MCPGLKNGLFLIVGQYTMSCQYSNDWILHSKNCHFFPTSFQEFPPWSNGGGWSSTRTSRVHRAVVRLGAGNSLAGHRRFLLLHDLNLDNSSRLRSWRRGGNGAVGPCGPGGRRRESHIVGSKRSHSIGINRQELIQHHSHSDYAVSPRHCTEACRS